MKLVALLENGGGKTINIVGSNLFTNEIRKVIYYYYQLFILYFIIHVIFITFL